MKLINARVLYFLTMVIAGLLVINIIFSLSITNSIDKSIKTQETSDSLRYMTKDVVRYLAGMEMALRGYFLDQKEININVYSEVTTEMDSAFSNMESKLRRQGFQMEYFYNLRNNINIYKDSSRKMMDYVSKGDSIAFNRIYSKYYGDLSYNRYVEFENALFTFENNINKNAEEAYFLSLKQNVWLSVILVILIIPVILYSNKQSINSLKLSNQLRQLEEDKKNIVLEQKKQLERLVAIRTEEIETQNEELQAQNEELIKANQIIDEQNEVINKKNEELGIEVNRKTANLRSTNKELATRIEKMEQFTFIVSHNLKSYVAQIKGLSSILSYSNTKEDQSDILRQINQSVSNLDHVLKDLSAILNIESAREKSEYLKVDEVINAVIDSLSDKIKASHAKINMTVKISEIYAIPAYINSIFFNLISNAIKYKKPNETPIIEIVVEKQNNSNIIKIADQGIGIDMNRHKNDVFSIYKRFHDHIEGRGLGLYLCKVQVETMNGNIKVKSEVNKGTTFTVTLPLNENKENGEQ